MIRHVLMAAVAALALTASVPEANAVVCAAGVYHAGCAGKNGAVVVHRHCYYRAGARICR